MTPAKRNVFIAGALAASYWLVALDTVGVSNMVSSDKLVQPAAPTLLAPSSAPVSKP